jgi:hypothetical protein
MLTLEKSVSTPNTLKILTEFELAAVNFWLIRKEYRIHA